MNSIKRILPLLAGSLVVLGISAVLGGLAFVRGVDNNLGFILAFLAIMFFICGLAATAENISEIIRLADLTGLMPRKLKGRAVKQYMAKICGREIISEGSFNVIVRYFDHRGWKKEAWIRNPNNGKWGEEYRVGGTVHIKADDDGAEFDKEQPQVTEEEIEWQDRLMKEELTCYYCKKPLRMTAGTVSGCPSCGHRIVLPSIRSYIFRPEDNPTPVRKVYDKYGGVSYETVNEKKQPGGVAGLISSMILILAGIMMLCAYLKLQDNPLPRLMLIVALFMLGKGLFSAVSIIRDMKITGHGPRFRGKIFRYERAMWDFVDGIPTIVPVVRYFDKQGQMKETAIETGSLDQYKYAIGNTVEIETEYSGAAMVKWNYPFIKHSSLPQEDRLMDEAERAVFIGKKNGPCRSETYDESAEPVRLVCPTCGQETEVLPGTEASCTGCNRKLAFTFDKIAIWDSQTII